MRPVKAQASADHDAVESQARREPCFTERPVWRAVGTGWQHLHGRRPELGGEL